MAIVGGNAAGLGALRAAAMAAPGGAGEGLAALTLGGMGCAPAMGATGSLGQGQPNTTPAKPLAPIAGCLIASMIGSGAGASAVGGG